MFSREARAFRRSGDPRFVRTRPLDTVQNNADNSLSLCFCSSWFEISFIVFPPVRGPAIGTFHAHGTANRMSSRQGLRTEGDHPPCTPEPSSGGRLGKRLRSLAAMRTGVCNRACLKGPVRDAAEGERIDLLIVNAKVVLWECLQPAIWGFSCRSSLYANRR